MLITPEYVFKDVTHITPEWLAQKGIRALVLDIDNTLTADRSQELPDEVAGWLDTMRKAGVRLTIVSNGAEKRVRPFAQKLGLAYLYRSAKPLPFALMAAQHRMGVKHSQMAMVGDQLYADRMAAALYGIPGLMVIPRGPDLGAQVILKRKWEKKTLAGILRPGREDPVSDDWKIRFGTAGTSDSFAAQGYKTSLEVPEYTAKMGLNAFEYQCGRGVRLGLDKAAKNGRTGRAKGYPVQRACAVLYQHVQSGRGKAAQQHPVSAAKCGGVQSAGRQTHHLPLRQLRQAEPGSGP